MSRMSDVGVRVCRVCVQGKMRRRNMHSRDGHRAEKKFRGIHTDVSEYGTVGQMGRDMWCSLLTITPSLQAAMQ